MKSQSEPTRASSTRSKSKFKKPTSISSMGASSTPAGATKTSKSARTQGRRRDLRRRSRGAQLAHQESCFHLQNRPRRISLPHRGALRSKIRPTHRTGLQHLGPSYHRRFHHLTPEEHSQNLRQSFPRCLGLSQRLGRRPRAAAGAKPSTLPASGRSRSTSSSTSSIPASASCMWTPPTSP